MGLGLWYLRPLSSIVQLIVGGRFLFAKEPGVSSENRGPVVKFREYRTNYSDKKTHTDTYYSDSIYASLNKVKDILIK